jgi:hypothetical protein
MKTRTVKIFTGQIFEVPQHIVRLDQAGTHGWQVRYGEWSYIADHSKDGSGAEKALEAAIVELKKRIANLPAPTRLRTVPLKNNTSDMPLGISGPVPRLRKGRRIPYYSFQVSVPVPYGSATNTSVYIGTETTITDERIAIALEKAIQIRDKAVAAAKAAHTDMKRKQVSTK